MAVTRLAITQIRVRGAVFLGVSYWYSAVSIFPSQDIAQEPSAGGVTSHAPEPNSWPQEQRTLLSSESQHEPNRRYMRYRAKTTAYFPPSSPSMRRMKTNGIPRPAQCAKQAAGLGLSKSLPKKFGFAKHAR